MLVLNLLRRATPFAASLILAVSALCAAEPAAAVDFGNIPGPSGEGRQVEIRLPRSLIALAEKVVAGQRPEVAKLLGSVESVQVRVVSLDAGNRAAVAGRIGEIHAELSRSGWQTAVAARDGGDDVVVFIRSGADETIEGFAAMVIDGEAEAVFVNVVGSIRPEQIAEVAEALHVPHLAAVTAAVGR